jgi:hypothetical protein
MVNQPISLQQLCITKFVTHYHFKEWSRFDIPEIIRELLKREHIELIFTRVDYIAKTAPANDIKSKKEARELVAKLIESWECNCKGK